MIKELKAHAIIDMIDRRKRQIKKLYEELERLK